MELVIPLIALGGLFIVSNQSKKSESFKNNESGYLPNTDVPDHNYPVSSYILNEPSNFTNPESDLTTKLSTVNRYDGGQSYTDKYFNPNSIPTPATSANT